MSGVMTIFTTASNWQHYVLQQLVVIQSEHQRSLEQKERSEEQWQEREKKKKTEWEGRKVKPLAREINCPNYEKVWLVVSVHGRQFIFITIS